MHCSLSCSFLVLQEAAPAALHKLHLKNQTGSPTREVGCSQQKLKSFIPSIVCVYRVQLPVQNHKYSKVWYLDQNCFPLHLLWALSCLNSTVSSLLQVTISHLPSFPSWLFSSDQFWACFLPCSCCLSDEQCWKVLQSKVWIHMFQLSNWASCKKAQSPCSCSASIAPTLQSKEHPSYCLLLFQVLRREANVAGMYQPRRWFIVLPTSFASAFSPFYPLVFSEERRCCRALSAEEGNFFL